MSGQGWGHVYELLLGANRFTGHAEEMKEKLRLLHSQREFSIGDTAFLAGSNVPLERDMAVVRMVDYRDYLEQYPDWADGDERSDLRDHVCCEHFSRMDPEVTIGWFHRASLMPVTPEQYAQAVWWRDNGWPDGIPDWLLDAYNRYTEGLNDSTPDLVPRPVHCPECDSLDVEMKVIRQVSWTARAGMVTRPCVDREHEKHDLYVPLVEPDEDLEWIASLTCNNCGKFGEMAYEEWYIPDAE